MKLSVFGFAIVLAAALLGWAGYKMRGPAGPEAMDTDWVIVTQSPQPCPRSIPFPSQDQSYPVGSRIVALSLENADSIQRVLSNGLIAAGAPDLSPDGRRIVFGGKASSDGKWRIYETTLRGDPPKLWVSMEGNCGDPAYLSDDRIVFSCQSEQGIWTLFTATREQSEARQITFGKDSARYPTVLRDGRILFSREQTSPNQSCQSIGLFTINPDGTLLDAFTESHAPGEAHLRPRESPDRKTVAFLYCSSRTRFPKVAVVDSGFPARISFPDTSSLRVNCVNFLKDGTLLMAGRPRGKHNGFGIYRLSEGNFQAAFDDPQWNEIEVLPVTHRRPPLGRPPQYDSSKPYGELVCYDVRRSDGKIGPAPDAPVAASFELETAEGSRFGPFALNDDGAFYLKVPPDVPLRVSILNEDGTRQAACNWIWVRPGEKRACFGCHEGLAAAPVNRPLPTLSRPPVNLLAQRDQE